MFLIFCFYKTEFYGLMMYFVEWHFLIAPLVFLQKIIDKILPCIYFLQFLSNSQSWWDWWDPDITGWKTIYALNVLCCKSSIPTHWWLLHHLHKRRVVVKDLEEVTVHKSRISNVIITQHDHSLSCLMHVVSILRGKKPLHTEAGKFNYCSELMEKGNNTEKNMTLRVDNLHIIDCHCSGMSVIHSVTLC